MRKVMLLLALLFALSSAAPPPLEPALEPALEELRSKDSGKDNLELRTHEDYPKRTHDERMLSMAYTLKNHFAHKSLTLKVAQEAIDAHVANGRMPGEHKLLLATEVGTLLGPAAAAAAGLPAPSAMLPMVAPILTSSPDWAVMVMMPDASAVISVETLSVSTVTRRSPLFTVAPLATCQEEMTAEVMDSPTVGTVIGDMGMEFEI
jgi:hypothetical protein